MKHCRALVLNSFGIQASTLQQLLHNNKSLQTMYLRNNRGTDVLAGVFSGESLSSLTSLDVNYKLTKDNLLCLPQLQSLGFISSEPNVLYSLPDTLTALSLYGAVPDWNNDDLFSIAWLGRLPLKSLSILNYTLEMSPQRFRLLPSCFPSLTSLTFGGRIARLRGSIVNNTLKCLRCLSLRMPYRSSLPILARFAPACEELSLSMCNEGLLSASRRFAKITDHFQEWKNLHTCVVRGGRFQMEGETRLYGQFHHQLRHLSLIDTLGIRLQDVTILSNLESLHFGVYTENSTTYDFRPQDAVTTGDLMHLSSLPRLSRLILAGRRLGKDSLRDISIWGKNLITLTIAWNPVPDLSPLLHLTALSCLEVGEQNVSMKETELAILAQLPVLTQLKLPRTQAPSFRRNRCSILDPLRARGCHITFFNCLVTCDFLINTTTK